MNQPSSRNLSHDFAAWKGLSLRELFWIVIVTTPGMTAFFIVVGVFLNYPIACGCVGFIIGFILAITVWPKSIARLKEGKPHGYVMKKAIHLLVSLRIRHSPWIDYKGGWRSKKNIGVSDV